MPNEKKALIFRSVRPSLFDEASKPSIKTFLHQKFVDDKEDGSDDESSTEESKKHQQKYAPVLVSFAMSKNSNPPKSRNALSSTNKKKHSLKIKSGKAFDSNEKLAAHVMTYCSINNRTISPLLKPTERTTNP